MYSSVLLTGKFAFGLKSLGAYFYMKHLQSKQCCYLCFISMERLKSLQEFGKEILPFGLEWLPILSHHAIPGIRRASLVLQD